MRLQLVSIVIVSLIMLVAEAPKIGVMLLKSKYTSPSIELYELQQEPSPRYWLLTHTILAMSLVILNVDRMFNFYFLSKTLKGKDVVDMLNDEDKLYKCVYYLNALFVMTVMAQNWKLGTMSPLLAILTNSMLILLLCNNLRNPGRYLAIMALPICLSGIALVVIKYKLYIDIVLLYFNCVWNVLVFMFNLIIKSVVNF